MRALLTRVCGCPQERGKKDVLEVVMLQRPGRRQMKQVAAVFEQSGNEDVLELQMANAAEARAWMAAFHNPRYLHARGLHLASVVAGREAASALDTFARATPRAPAIVHSYKRVARVRPSAVAHAAHALRR